MQARTHASLAVLALVAIAFTTTTVAAPPAKDDKPAGKVKKDEKKSGRKKKTPRGLAFKALRTVIDDATFKDMTFEEFTEWLARQTEANIIVRWKIIEDAGIDIDTRFSLKLREVTIRQITKYVFAEVTAGLDIELAVKADDNTLIISTRRDLSTELVIRTYDVQDLLIDVPNFYSLASAFGGGAVPGGAIAGSGIGEYGSKTQDELAQELMNLITSHVEPESWAVNGGKGTISFFRGKIIVRNNLIVHELIGGPNNKKPARKP